MRRSSDGDAISLMESSTDGLEGEEPGSPRAWGAVDWTDSASSLAHVFVSTSSSLDTCYLQSECLHSGHRCGTGHDIIAHFYFTINLESSISCSASARLLSGLAPSAG